MEPISLIIAFFLCLEKSFFSVGLVLGCFDMTVFVSSILFGIYVTRIGFWYMFFGGAIIEGVCAVLFGVLNWSPGGHTFTIMAIIVRCVEALGHSMCKTAALTVIGKEFPGRTGFFIGLIEACEGFGLMLGPPLGGFLYELAGFSLPFFIGGALLLICGVAAALLLPYSPPSSTSDVSGDIIPFFTNPFVFFSAACITTSAIMITFYEPTLSIVLRKISFIISPYFLYFPIHYR